jgi:hypothetical protein
LGWSSSLGLNDSSWCWLLVNSVFLELGDLLAMHALLVGQKFDGLLEGVEGILETEEVVQVEGEVEVHLLGCILVC